MTTLLIIALIILTILLYPSNKVKARAQTVLQEIETIKIDARYKEGDIIQDGCHSYLILEIIPKRTLKEKLQSFTKAVKTMTGKKNKDPQMHFGLQSEMQYGTTKRKDITVATIVIAISIIAAIDITLATLANRRTGLSRIPVNLAAILIIASCFMCAVLYIIIIIHIRSARKMKRHATT